MIKPSLSEKLLSDIPAAVVVFLVALPLCLGIALASDANPISGIIAGMVGGMVVGALSGSPLSVSGPAAGLTAIVAVAITELQSYEIFLVSVMIAGVIQIIMGYAKAGMISYYIPDAVIQGMLAAIGLLLIIKQIPFLLGDEKNTLTNFLHALSIKKLSLKQLIAITDFVNPLAFLIGVISLVILLLYENKHIKQHRFSKLLPAPLLVVTIGMLINNIAEKITTSVALKKMQLVSLPIFEQPISFFTSLSQPNIDGFTQPQVWLTAITIAIVASLESLLSIEAVDQLDPEKRITSPHRELKAQGVGNLVSGFLGGLPITSVIVRSSANVNAGASSKLASIFHGFLLLMSVLFLPEWLNQIPNASLAAILIFTGYKLANIALFKSYLKKPWDQGLPFMITILAILISNLLAGILLGMLVALFFSNRFKLKNGISVIEEKDNTLIIFEKEVYFFNKGTLKTILQRIAPGTTVWMNTSASVFIDQDIVDMMHDFVLHAESRDIIVHLKTKEG